MYRRTHNEANKTKFLLNLQWEVTVNETNLNKL